MSVIGKFPWQGEVDFWTDHVDDLHLIAVRNSQRVWCGYVGMPADAWEHVHLDRLPHHSNENDFFGDRCEFGGRPGYLYVGFNCWRRIPSSDGLADYSPDDCLAGRADAMRNATYRQLPYVQALCRRIANECLQQLSWWPRFLRWLGYDR